MINILLDECLPVKLKYRFEDCSSNFQVSTVTGNGWTGVKNGELLILAQQQFDVFITIDKNISYQLDLSKYAIVVIALKAKSNRYKDLLAFVEPASSLIDSAEQGKFYEAAANN
ncbi:hypothetical protein BH23BAC3_BH23BAC3_30980 [soil metagenome]